MDRLEEIKNDRYRLFRRPTINDASWLIGEIESLRELVDDLQSGMYVNCVYCGHRYGPKETTPVSMADALKAHVESCPKHPMSVIKQRLDRLEEAAQAVLDNDDPQDWPTCYHLLEDAIKGLEE